MNKLRMLTMGIVTLGTAVALYRKMAEERGQAPARFVDAMAQKGIAEIEAAKLALEKSTSTEVKAFAYEMIDDHTALDKDLRQLARNKGYELPQEADLVSRAKELLLSLREEIDFDKAYAAHQIQAHEQAVSISKKATQLDDFDVSNFANKATRKLEHHLQMARDLQKHINEGPLKPGNGKDTSNDADSGPAAGTWPLKGKDEASEPTKGDTPSATRPGEVAGSDNSGGAMTKTPAPDEPKGKSAPPSPLADEDKSRIAKGTPQQGRGNAKNPGH